METEVMVVAQYMRMTQLVCRFFNFTPQNLKVNYSSIYKKLPNFGQVSLFSLCSIPIKSIKLNAIWQKLKKLITGAQEPFCEKMSSIKPRTLDKVLCATARTKTNLDFVFTNRRHIPVRYIFYKQNLKDSNTARLHDSTWNLGAHV